MGGGGGGGLCRVSQREYRVEFEKISRREESCPWLELYHLSEGVSSLSIRKEEPFLTPLITE